MPWKHNERIIKVGKAWVADNGTQHPATWSRWSSEKKTAEGLTWEDPPASEEPFDSRFYWGRQTDGTLIERSLTDVNEVDSDGNAIIDSRTNQQLVTKGLKTLWIEQTKETANNFLSKWDWQVVRKSEKNTAIDSNVATYRDAVRTKCASIETAIVNMAQDYTFSNNYPLIDKKGYFGERMETSPAAGRYIECRLGKIAKILLFDDMNQVEMIPNFDETVKIAELANCPVVISGGVSSLNDIKKAKELNNNKIEGIIVGKAIYDGDIKLEELAKEISA